jgi:asparagine synthase (glutamine-hydrolysing)
VCNGEIYNAPLLSERLAALGHGFRSASDNEVILHAYEQWGLDCVEHLEGMFAFALWDNNKRRLFAARDRAGIKPLYYALAPGDGVFLASEAGALLSLMGRRPLPDPLALAYVLTLGYVPSPLAVWEGVSKLEPGHLLTWERGRGLLKRPYWEPPRDVDSAESHGVQGWARLFEEVVEQHMLSDVEVGLFLSGGLDSSSVAVASTRTGHRPRALTVIFPGSERNEGSVAAEVASHLCLDQQGIPLALEGLDRLIDETVKSSDEPQGYSALLSMKLLCRSTAGQLKVVLAGDGGDEVFGGYRWYENLDWRRSSGAVPARAALRQMVRRLPLPRLARAAERYFIRCSPLHRHARRLFPRFLPEEVEFLFEPMGLKLSDEQLLAPLQRHFEPALPLKRALQRVDLMTFCTDSILAKVDRMSMAHSIEVRVPFLDRRVVEWGLTAPAVGAEDGPGKALLREYLRGRVPDTVLSHPKQGFSVPVLEGCDWDAAVGEIEQGPWVGGGYWSPRWPQLVRPDSPWRQARIWVLLVLTRWAEHWLGEGDLAAV